jgi:protoporphyrinogen oxidase
MTARVRAHSPHQKRIVIIGAGLAGLSAAYHLRGHGSQVFEKEASVGGLCRSVHQDGFTFDFAGHLLHLRNKDARHLVERLLPRQLKTHNRKAFVFSSGMLTSYPFQASLYGLPAPVVKDCLMGFIQARQSEGKPARQDNVAKYSFKDWILKTFGPGIAQHFMIPFNEKLWRAPLEELSADWVNRFIPCPTMEEVVRGALGVKNPSLGYNPTFLYPVRGGIECLPRSFLHHVSRVHCGKEVVRIDAASKEVVFKDGSCVAYDELISTIPLPQLIRILKPCPPRLKRIRKKLRHVSVCAINLGVEKKRLPDIHWIYFPEPSFPFYRVGFPSSFSRGTRPKDCSTLSIEISHVPTETPDEKGLLKESLKALRRCGILESRDKIVFKEAQRIEYAYVLYDHFRRAYLPRVFEYLKGQHIHSIGRYGRWEYSSMEDALLQGREIAREICD